MRLFQEQNLPSKAVQGEDSAAEFMFLAKDVDDAGVYKDFEGAQVLFTFDAPASFEGQYFVFH